MPLDGPDDTAKGPLIHGVVRIQTFMGATTRLLVDESPARSNPPGVASGPHLEGLSVDVGSRIAGRWPVGSHVVLELAAGSSRVVASGSTLSNSTANRSGTVGSIGV